MYTTLLDLKHNSACEGGFGRLLSFFGTAVAVKEQKIPLHVIALISGKDDAGWALENCLTIDPAQYQEFYKRTLPSVWNLVLRSANIHRAHKTASYSGSVNERKKAYFAKHYDLTEELITAVTAEAIEPLLERLKMIVSQHEVFNQIKEAKPWKGPQEYIDYVHDKFASNLTNLRTGSTLDSKYAFPSYSKKRSKGENFAIILKPEGTYDFMQTLKFKTPKGYKIDPKTAVVTMSLSIEDQFRVVNNLNARVLVDRCDSDDRSYPSTNLTWPEDNLVARRGDDDDDSEEDPDEERNEEEEEDEEEN